MTLTHAMLRSCAALRQLLAGAPLDVLAWGVLQQVLIKDRELVRSELYQPMDSPG
jgi:hypothetical protein